MLCSVSYMHFSQYWQRPIKEQCAGLKGRWVRSVQKAGHSGPLKRDLQTFCSGRLDFSQTLHRPPLWDPTLSKLVSRSKIMVSMSLLLLVTVLPFSVTCEKM